VGSCGLRASCSSELLSSWGLSGLLSLRLRRLRAIYEDISFYRTTSVVHVRRTQERTPPIRPRLYPAAKSEDSLAPPRPGISRWLSRDKAVGDRAVAPCASSWSATSRVGVLAGLAGRLDCQNWRMSLLSSCPVVAQLALMLSRNSAMLRFRSSSPFFSHETLSSLRDVPRLSWRSMYWS
jgi:hypothetical protein